MTLGKALLVHATSIGGLQLLLLHHLLRRLGRRLWTQLAKRVDRLPRTLGDEVTRLALPVVPTARGVGPGGSIALAVGSAVACVAAAVASRRTTIAAAVAGVVAGCSV